MAEFLEGDKGRKANEGGYAKVNGDRGKRTYCGIAEAFWSTWPGWHTVNLHEPLKQGEIINDRELEGLVSAFYKREFWDKLKGDYINDQEMANQLYDSAINIGLKPAIELIQKTLNIPQTGKMDSTTLNMINLA